MKLKKTTLRIRTKDFGMVPVNAYAISDTGLFIHRILNGGMKQTDMNYWQISTVSGYRVLSGDNAPCTRKHMLEKAEIMFGMDWDKPDAFWYTDQAQPYIDTASTAMMRL